MVQPEDLAHKTAGLDPGSQHDGTRAQRDFRFQRTEQRIAFPSPLGGCEVNYRVSANSSSKCKELTYWTHNGQGAVHSRAA